MTDSAGLLVILGAVTICALVAAVVGRGLWPSWRVTRRIGLGAVLLLLTWKATPYPRGWLAARADLAAGQYKRLAAFGPPRTPDEHEAAYFRLLSERYGVRYDFVTGCVVTGELQSYMDGYNAASEAALRARYGIDVFVHCRALAQGVGAKQGKNRPEHGE
jgi:hypothetical protein